jgi:hypothetical protein
MHISGVSLANEPTVCFPQFEYQFTNRAGVRRIGPVAQIPLKVIERGVVASQRVQPQASLTTLVHHIRHAQQELVHDRDHLVDFALLLIDALEVEQLASRICLLLAALRKRRGESMSLSSII